MQWQFLQLRWDLTQNPLVYCGSHITGTGIIPSAPYALHLCDLLRVCAWRSSWASNSCQKEQNKLSSVDHHAHHLMERWQLGHWECDSSSPGVKECNEGQKNLTVPPFCLYYVIYQWPFSRSINSIEAYGV